MKFTESKLKGAYIIELEPFVDERGTFARQFCKQELMSVGIDFNICQCNISHNYKKGTLRGMHYQKEPYLEAKIVSVTNGKIFDCIVDLRKDSPTYLQWDAVEISKENNKVIYIPANFAHGFKTLTDDTTVYYQLNEYFQKDYYDGIRYNDPKIAIKWPLEELLIINNRDMEYKLL